MSTLRTSPRDRTFRPTIIVATAVAAVAAVVVLVVLAGVDSDSAPEPGNSLDITPRAPDAGALDLGAVSLDGDPIPLRTLLGDDRPVVLNFFASWCAPCVQEMPDLEEVFGEVGDDVRFVGLAMQDRASDAERIVEATGVTYDIARDPTGEILNAFGGLVMPTTVFLTADGTVVDVNSGELDADELRDRIAELFEIDA